MALWEEALRVRGSGPTKAPPPPPRAPASVKGQRSTQVVVKIATFQKTMRGARNTLSYIASHGGSEDDNRVYDDAGRELTGGEGAAYLASWNIVPDEKNFSKAGREATAEERKAMPDAKKYYERQTVHFIVSFPTSHSLISDEKIHDLAAETLKPFREAGHRYQYAIHRHQANPHIHVLMEYEGMEDKLRFTPKSLNAFRDHSAAVLRSHGIEATNRIRATDKTVLEKVKAGEERAKSPTKPPRPSASSLESQAPTFYSRHGAGLEARRAGEADRISAYRAAALPELHAASERGLKEWAEGRYKDPSEAATLFKELAAENSRLAFWHARNRPETFGQLKEDDNQAQLSGKSVRIGKEWKTKATDAINQAEATTPEQIKEGRKATADRNKAILAEQRAEKNRQADLAFLARFHPDETKVDDPAAKTATTKKPRLWQIQEGLGRLFTRKPTPEAPEPTITHPTTQPSQPATKPAADLPDDRANTGAENKPPVTVEETMRRIKPQPKKGRDDDRNPSSTRGRTR